MIRPLAAAALLAASAWLAGCATPSLPPAAGAAVSGRLALQIDADGQQAARSMTASFELRGQAEDGQLGLSTPLGTMIAEARWMPGRVVLVTSRGERRFANLGDLTREVLGESLPVEALFDWLAGRPWPGAASESLDPKPGFNQLGWRIDLAQFADARVAAVREQPPRVSVRVKLDRP